MRSITIKNIPDPLHQRLRQEATRHHRSLNSEIIACLQQAIGSQPVEAEALLAKARAIRTQFKGQLTDAAIKEMKSQGRP